MEYLQPPYEEHGTVQDTRTSQHPHISHPTSDNLVKRVFVLIDTRGQDRKGKNRTNKSKKQFLGLTIISFTKWVILYSHRIN